MKAIVCTKYGPPDVLELRDVEKPTPKDNEVLVRVHAASVAMGDCELRGLKLPFGWKLLLRIGLGIRAPRRKILGQGLAGEIESTGRDVTRFKKGDKSFRVMPEKARRFRERESASNGRRHRTPNRTRPWPAEGACFSPEPPGGAEIARLRHSGADVSMFSYYEPELFA